MSKNHNTQYSDEHRCDICGIKFDSVEVFKKHVQIIHQIPFYTKERKLESISATGITSNATNGDQTLYQCHFCSKSYKIKARLRIHLKVKHCLNIGTANNTNANEENCNTSNVTTKFKICEKMLTLNTNLTTTKSNQNFDGTVTINTPIELQNQNLLEQQKIKEEPFQKPWKCDICSKFYTTKYFLKKHKRIHTGETPYKCNICNKSFTFQQSYHKHLLYHSDDKPHICKICNRAFKELSTLHNHERIHSGEKPFVCEVCGKSFRQRVSNYVHQRTHTGAKPYSCGMCFRKFRYKVTLRTHKCTTNLFETFSKAHQNYNNEPNTENVDYIIEKIKMDENLSKNNKNLENLIPSDGSTINVLENNIQKLLQNVEILANNEIILSNSNRNNLICKNDFKKYENDLNKESLNKSLDEFVAESCNKLGIENCNEIDNNQNNNCLPLANSTPSPSEQLQQLCLYSPSSIERNLNINEDSLKQLCFEVNYIKPS